MWWAVITVLFCAAAVTVWSCADIGSGVWMKTFCREKTAEKVVYLTFDDGPEHDVTPAVLDVLKRRGACAAFFIIGKKIAGEERTLRRIVGEGHLAGVHSFTHADAFPLYGRRRITEEMEKCRVLMENVTGREVRLFRPPFGVMNPDIAAAAGKCGMKVVGWDVRSLDTMHHERTDWVERTVERIIGRVRCGSVILLHDRMRGADKLLEVLLDRLDAEGYRYDRNLPADMM